MFFKLFFKFIIITALFMGIAFYGNYLTTGKLPPFLQQAQNISVPNLDQARNKADDVLSSLTKPGQNYIYKWQDESGQIYLTSEQPAEGIEFELIKLQKDVNVLPSVSTENTANTHEKNMTSNLKGSDLSVKDVYSPEKVQQLKQDAEALREQLNQRVDLQNELLTD